MAGKIKGITIQLNGETTGLDKALEGVNKKSKELNSELRQVDKLLKLDPGNTDLLAQKQKLLKDAVGNTVEKLDALKEAQKQVADQVKKGEIGEEQYRALQREIVYTEQELKKLESQLDKTNSKWKDASDKIGKFGAILTNAGEKLAPISAGAGAAATGLVALAIKAGQTADDLNTLSKQTGISTEELQIFKLASDRIDVSMETLTGSMAKLTKNMGNAKNGSKTATEAFEKLGIAFRDDLTGELRNNQDVFNEAIKALGEMTNETERDAIAMELFGRSAQDLNPLILGGADALKKMGEEAKKAGLILSQDALDDINEFNDEIDALKASAGATFMQLGVEIGKTLLPVLESLSEKLEGVLEWVRSLDQDTLKIILTILAVIAGLAPLLIIIGKIATGISALMSVVSSLGPILGALGTAIGALSAPVLIIIGVIGALIGAFIALYKNNEEFRSKVTKIWESIKAMFSVIIEQIKEIISIGLANIQAFWQEHGDQINAIISKAWELIEIIFVTAAENLEEIIQTFTALAKGFWNLFGEDIKAITSVLWETIKGIFSGALQIIEGLLDVFIGLFTGDWERMKSGAIEIFQGLWTGVEAIVSGAWSLLSMAFTKLFNSIKSWFTDLKNNAIQWGKNMIQGFIDGILSMAKKVQNAVDDVMDGVSDFIGFNSPSKKGEGRHIVEWGYNMIEGFMDGMKKAMPALEITANQLIPSLDDIQAGTNNSNVSINNTFNIPNMQIRSDNDIREVAKELYALQKTNLRGLGLA